MNDFEIEITAHRMCLEAGGNWKDDWAYYLNLAEAAASDTKAVDQERAQAHRVYSARFGDSA